MIILKRASSGDPSGNPHVLVIIENLTYNLESFRTFRHKNTHWRIFHLIAYAKPVNDAINYGP